MSGRVRGTIDAMDQYSGDPIQISNDFVSTWGAGELQGLMDYDIDLRGSERRNK